MTREEHFPAHLPTIPFEHWAELARLRAESLRHPIKPTRKFPNPGYDVSPDLAQSILHQLTEMGLIVLFGYSAWEDKERYWDSTAHHDFDALDVLTLGKILLLWQRQEHWQQDTFRHPFIAGTGQRLLAALIRKAGKGHLPDGDV